VDRSHRIRQNAGTKSLSEIEIDAPELDPGQTQELMLFLSVRLRRRCPST